jgi:hypothetical protein
MDTQERASLLAIIFAVWVAVWLGTHAEIDPILALIAAFLLGAFVWLTFTLRAVSAWCDRVLSRWGVGR